MFTKVVSHLRQQYLGALCLFIVLGGTSYAVATNSIGSAQIKNNSIRSKDIRNNQVSSADVQNASLLAADFKAGQLPAGPRGAPGAPGVEAAADPIVGSWIASVNRGPTLPPVKSLQTFANGGGMVTVQNLGATIGSSAHGLWKRIGARNYANTFMFFRYNPTSGEYIGTTRLRCTFELAPDGQTFASVCSPEFRDAAGNLEPGSNVRRDPGTAERINVEPIPALP